MHNYAHGEVVLSALSLLFQNSMAHGFLHPQERLRDVLIILEQVLAPYPLCTNTDTWPFGILLFLSARKSMIRTL
jgi:hypothetical protein